MKKTPKQKCFVIMPFSQTNEKHTGVYWTEHYNKILKPRIEAHGLEAHRSRPLRDDVLRRIIKNLVTSPIVVADLTDANANVYWELGVRQSFAHCTITIAEDGTSLPFDISTKATLEYYPTDIQKMTEFDENFSSAIKDCIKNPNDTDSHVLEAITGRGSLYQVISRDESLRKLAALREEFKYNMNLEKEIVSKCKTNAGLRKEGKAGKMITQRLRSSCVELLISNRYIDEDESFYSLYSKYMDHFVAVSQQLVSWFAAPRGENAHVEDWLVEATVRYGELYPNILKNIDKQMKTLSASI